MNQLIVIAFDHFGDARDALTGLRALERDGRIRFEDTALIERDPDGTAHVKNEVSGTTETASDSFANRRFGSRHGTSGEGPPRMVRTTIFARVRRIISRNAGSPVCAQKPIFGLSKV